MNFSQLKKHQNIRLIEYTLEHKKYSVDQVCSDLTITSREFHFAKKTLFTMTNYQTDKLISSEQTDWCLSNEVLFNYLQFKEFEHSLKNSKKLNWIAVIALIVSTISMIITALSVSGKFV